MRTITEPRPIAAVLFDFDGTLTLPGHLDFAKIRAEMGCPQSESILDYLSSIEGQAALSEATRVLEEAETVAAAAAVPRAEAEEYVIRLKARGIRTGIITRNSRRSVVRALENFSSLRPAVFDIVISRDDDIRWKPHPDGVLHASSQFGIEPSCVAVVGDYRYDMEAARAASALAVYLDNFGGREPLPSCDAVVTSIGELRELLEPLLMQPAS